MTERLFKLSVNVPETHGQLVRDAIGNAGGGTVGAYTYCSFTVNGTGRFKPGKDSNPFIGQSDGTIEQVKEENINVSNILQSQLHDVLNAMIDAHPYEETNYEITELINIEDIK
jgi:hypothetical protein